MTKKKIRNYLFVLVFCLSIIGFIFISKGLFVMAPDCSCSSGEHSLIEHDDNCDFKQYYHRLSTELSIEKLLKKWGNLLDGEKSLILENLYKTDKEKYSHLLKSLTNSIVEQTIDSEDSLNLDISVSGPLPLDASVDISPVKISNNNKDIVFSYDIKVLDVQGAQWQPSSDSKVKIELTNVNLDGIKKLEILHIMDDVDDIKEGLKDGSVEIISLDDFPYDININELKPYMFVLNELGYKNHIAVSYLDDVKINQDKISFYAESFSIYTAIDKTGEITGDIVMADKNGQTFYADYDTEYSFNSGEDYLTYRYWTAYVNEGNYITKTYDYANDAKFRVSSEATHLSKWTVRFHHNNLFGSTDREYFVHFITITPECTVSFDNGGHGNNISNLSQHVNDTIKLPNSPGDVLGYNFTGWKSSVDGEIYQPGDSVKLKGSVKYTAQWEGPLSSNYTVKYYFQNVYDDNYTIDESKTKILSGYIGEKPTYTVETFVGFDNNNVKIDYSNDIILEDGSTVVSIKYNRLNYNVEYVYEGTVPKDAPSLPETVSYRYGTENIEIGNTILSLKGYAFEWDKTGKITITDNVIITGKWTPLNDAYYKVYYYLKDTTTSLVSSKTVENVQYEHTYNENAVSIPGYTVDNSAKSVVAGYYEEGKEISIIFYYTPNTDTKYTVRYVEYENDTIIGTIETVIRTGTTGEVATYEDKEFEGFTYSEVSTNNVNISGDETTVIEVKFTRNRYNLNWNVYKNDDSSYRDTGVIIYKYQEEIKLPDAPFLENYTFFGWNVIAPDNIDNLPTNMPAYNIEISGTLVQNVRDLIIKKDWSSNDKTSVLIVSGDNFDIEVVVEKDGQAVIKDLPIGNTYTIKEVDWSLDSTDNIVSVEIKSENNTVIIPSNNVNYGWFRSGNLRKNIFGNI